MTPAPRPWIVGPRIDLLCLANLTWPIFVAVGLLAADRVRLNVVFLVLAVAHRWLTLPLVVIDWEVVRARRGVVLLGVAGVAGGYAIFIALGADAMTLGFAVMLYDSWHRAGQHYGVLRLYERALVPAQPGALAAAFGPGGLVLRAVVLYTFVRAFGIGATGMGHRFYAALAGDWPRYVDPMMLFLAVALVLTSLRALARQPLGSWGRALPALLYLGSTTALYVALLVVVMTGARAWSAALIAASLYFHSVEYLTVVSWRLRGRLPSLRGWRRALVRGWAPLLVAHIAVFVAVSAWMPQRWVSSWYYVNAFVSLLHFQLDGSIWKRTTEPRRKRAAPPRGAIAGGAEPS